MGMLVSGGTRLGTTIIQINEGDLATSTLGDTLFQFGGTYEAWVSDRIRFEVTPPNKPLEDARQAKVVRSMKAQDVLRDAGAGKGGYGAPPQLLSQVSLP